MRLQGTTHCSEDATFASLVFSEKHAKIRTQIHDRFAAYLHASCLRPSAVASTGSRSRSPINGSEPGSRSEGAERASSPSTSTSPIAMSLFERVVIPRSVEEMLQLTRTYHVASDESIAAALMLMQRYLLSRGEALTTRNVRALFVVALMLAQKSLEDVPHNNATFANLAEIAPCDINILEIDFLSAVRFRIRCHPDKVARMLEAFVLDVLHTANSNASAAVSVSVSSVPSSSSSLMTSSDSAPNTVRSAHSAFTSYSSYTSNMSNTSNTSNSTVHSRQSTPSRHGSRTPSSLPPLHKHRPSSRVG
eukprot:TRINITY_DN497_c0_g2_i4.p1 TRINITY_DN497_c0_g2~~TRINITY_DN497_c0_g2_i4.p1  ORF type:complete len:306 (-),score=60.61 TRINITY_DN497_c0_g2_i4:386-1303(-)